MILSRCYEYEDLIFIHRICPLIFPQEQRTAHAASIDQQREISRYLTSLNDWLQRDVHDRHSEIRAVTARVDQLRDLLLQVLNQGLRECECIRIVLTS